MNDSDTDLLTSCSVCILTFNRCEQLVKTLSYLYGEFFNTPIHFFVFNNGSTDLSENVLTQMAIKWERLTVIHSKINVGCAKGREELWKRTNTEFIFSLDDDVLIKKNDALDMLRLLRANKNAALVSPVIVDSISQNALNPIRGSYLNAKSFYEACFLMRSSITQIVGYMDPMLSVAGEGLDYSIRLRKSKFNIMRASNIVLHVDRIRSASELEYRRKEWLWAFCYLYWKNYMPPIALILSTRNLFAHVRVSLRKSGVNFAFSLMKHAVSGAKQGLQARKKSNQ